VVADRPLIRLQKISGFIGTLSDVAQDFLVNTRQVRWVRKKGVTPMTNILKTLAVVLTLVASSVALTASASADAYGWAYPDNFKDPAKVPLHSLGVESAIPAQYR
jgi:hypothetical protein